MSISKRTLSVSKKELAELFGLPEEVEILAVRKNSGFNEDYDFLLVSAEDVNIGDLKITQKQEDGVGTYRKLGLHSIAKALVKESTKDIDEVIKEAIKEYRIDKKQGFISGGLADGDYGKMIPFFDGHERILSEKDANSLLDVHNLLKSIDKMQLPNLIVGQEVNGINPERVQVQDIFQQALDNIKKQGK